MHTIGIVSELPWKRTKKTPNRSKRNVDIRKKQKRETLTKN